MNRCPVCMYPDLPYPAEDYHICPCCGTEFGNDDADRSHEELRLEWLSRGAPWFFGNPPADWNPIAQLVRAGLLWTLAYIPDATEAEIGLSPIRSKWADMSENSVYLQAV